MFFHNVLIIVILGNQIIKLQLFKPALNLKNEFIPLVMDKRFAEKVNEFNASLEIQRHLPEGVTAMNPFKEEKALAISGQFNGIFYGDDRERIGVFGINPGRFGAGITGIPFTDPIRLHDDCGIENPFEKRPEMSSEFIYKAIRSYGGPKAFYSVFFLTAVCPLGFVKEGKNMNYYDSKRLQDAVHSFIIDTMKKQIDFGLDTRLAICLGEGKNYKYFIQINREYQFFKEIIPLSHPRYIMQYKRKFLNDYFRTYLEVLQSM